ncbi:MAG: Asp23/Gls24 family envelope stress response protein [Firmicutes bacterium]|nr:Asp23/Gls24 family envelope stress response protein [Bacillota bacterium]
MSDSFVVDNEIGKIVLTKNIVVQIVSEVIEETDGVRLAGFKEMLSRVKNNIAVDFNADGAPDIDVYVVIKFGTSISNSTYAIINEVKNRILNVMETAPAAVNIHIVGTQTKKGIAKRNIEVRRRYDASE